MADLHLRVVAEHPGAGRVGLHDVVVTAEPTHSVAELAAALASHVGHDGTPALVWRGRSLDPSLSLGRSGIVAGDELVLDGRPTTPARPDPTAEQVALDLIAVDLIAGPESGRSHLVARPGRYTVGRSAGVAVAIDDPSVSRRHAVLDLHRTGRVTIEPCVGAANGVLVNDIEADATMPIEPTDVIALGATRLAVRAVPHREPPRNDRFGRIDFHRTPYRPPVVSDRPTEPVGPIPDRHEPRRLPWIGVLAPLAAGGAMYLFTRQLHFLALTLVSPVVMLGSVVEDRRSGRRTARERIARFRADLDSHRRRFERLRDGERVERFRSAPDLADLIRRAELRTIDLWARGRTAPDFLSVRLGLGPDTVGFAIELAAGGADDLRDEAAAAVAHLDRLDDVPVTANLVADAVLAIQGTDRDVVDGVAASIVVQAATLHSPEDLTVAAAVAPDRPFDWFRWLPHARSVTSPLPGSHVAPTTGATDDLVDRLIEVARRRTGEGSPAGAWPRVLVVLDAGLAPEPARLSHLLDLAPAAGISVVWLTSTPAEVPRQASRTLEVRRSPSGAMRGRLWSTDPRVADRPVEVEHLRPILADRAARALAPVRDASTGSLATTIPRVAPLLDVLGVGRPSAAWVLEHWQHRRPGGLRFPVGVAADGPIELDLVEDGPHTLIGGTSGSGKSELLQAMVASLAVQHPPTRLNFLFVDYKGGASSQVFEHLPHTVGSVTNLSSELATRALVSLRAELHRRMALLEGRAKDLDELVAVAPEEAPPSLVIVIDEFATLVREIPDFVDGIVDIAQRGRSLGIHLVLATQRPTGSVNENILANTNLRISLRMLDRGESTAIVGSPDAAEIPVPLRGRGFVRLGPGRLVEFQAAFTGAPLLADQVRPPVLVAPFASTDDSPGAAPVAAADGASQLIAVVDAVSEADRRLGLPAPHRPWRDVLPDVVTLADLLAGDGLDDHRSTPGRFAVVGLLDAPERQEQRPAVVDLEAGGGLLVFGSGGAGATTLLRTIAASVGLPADAGGTVVVAFDVAGRGLAGLASLPHVTAIATGDDLEALSRHLLVLDAEVGRRRRLLAAAGAEDLTAFARDHSDAPPRIVVLIDGFGGLAGSLLPGPGAAASDEWADRIVRLIVDGRHVGVHAVITADRRNAVPARVHAAIANRLVLRHADDSAAADHGVPVDRIRGLPPGRGLLQGSMLVQGWALVQVASVSADPSARAQAEALSAWGERIGEHVGGRVDHWSRTPGLCSEPLPDRVVSVPTTGGVVIGVADVTGHPVGIDLDWSNATVCGPPRSGRSTALGAFVRQLAGRPRGGAGRIVVLGPAASPLRLFQQTPGVCTAFGSEASRVLERLASDEAIEGPAAAHVLVVDDADHLDDPAFAPAVERLARTDRVGIVAAVETRSMSGYTTNAFVAVARRARRLLVLQPDDGAEFLQATGVRLALRPGLRLPPGRGVLLVERVPTVVQVVDALAAAAEAASIHDVRSRGEGRSITPHRYSRVDVP